MARPRRNPALLLSLFATVACQAAGAGPSGDGTDEGSTGDDPASTGDDAQASTGASGDTDADGSGDTGQPAADVPAQGLRISRVEANPGVAIPIAIDGAWVEGSQRNAPIPKGRDTAFRVYVDVDEASWTPRELEARLTVTQPDARETVVTATAMIAEDSSTTSLQSNFLLGVLAADMLPGAKLQVELFEVDGAAAAPEGTEPPRAFDDGANIIGIEGSSQQMRVVMVPVQYQYGSCSTLPELTPEALQPYADAMYQQNALESLEIEVHTPLLVDDLDLTDANDFFSLLSRVVQLRAQDGPAPNVYYYALFDNCGACISESGGCLLGVAPGQPGASQAEASQRAAIGVRYLGTEEMGIETFVHEIGHTQGRAHIACPGAQAAGPDFSYPYDNGSIGVWGFGVRDFEIRNPSNHKDYMSYCSPTWVSDWQWSATFARIKALTEWDALVVPPPQSTILVGTYNPETGESAFWTEPGELAPPDTVGSAASLALVGPGGPLHVSSADVDAWSEGPWVTVRANLPTRAVVDASEAFELRLPQHTARIERHAVRLDLADTLRAR